jgi:hypothetical protein
VVVRRQLTRAERVLFHQVHPLKLGADILSTVIAIPLLWQGEIVPGLVVALGTPLVASAVVLRFVDVEGVGRGPLGRYLRRYMTGPVQALRLACGLFVLAAAWWHQPVVIVIAVAIVVLAWTYGLLLDARSS